MLLSDIETNGSFSNITRTVFLKTSLDIVTLQLLLAWVLNQFVQQRTADAIRIWFIASLHCRHALVEVIQHFQLHS